MATVALEVADGAKRLDQLIAEISAAPHDWNEATTRFRIIDEILIGCLGWPKDEMHLEHPKGREYSDYELGKVPVAIWEAKREGKTFEVPVRRTPTLVHGLSSVMIMSADAAAAIEQVNGYCVSRGVDVAVATNGHQIIAFIADPTLSRDTKAKCAVVASLEQLRTIFPRIWQMLSPGGIAEGSLRKLLEQAASPQPPKKLSAFIPNYPQPRQPSDLQRSLTDIAELLLLNINEQEDIEEQFYKQCYCESGALSQHSLVSKQMLIARYASLFPDAEDAPQAKPVQAKAHKPALTPEILADAISNRPIALVGDVGAGKSSFLKHLMYVSAFEEFQHAIYAYVNLGRKGALQADLSVRVLDQIEEALLENYDIDIFEAGFVKSVYKSDIKRFDKSIYGALKESSPEKYEDKLLDMIAEKQSNRSEHLRRCVEYLAKEKRKQVIIALDNADQRSLEVQQEAFVISQSLAAEWSATVFISVRPKTFFFSKRSGALSAYPHRVFTVSPPRIDEVIEKRLVFALNIAEGRVRLERLRAISLNLSNIASLIKITLNSIDKFDDVKVFLENITGGNIRDLIQFLSGMFGNPNVDLQGAILALEQTGDYTFPSHEFWKVALKGDNLYFDPDKVLGANLFQVVNNDAREHFLAPILLSLLNTDGTHRAREGFVSYDHIVAELQSYGFRPGSIDAALRSLTNKKLIEAPERVTFEEDDVGIFGSMPASFRISTIGAYHLDVWMCQFAYLDAVCVDTPIFDDSYADALRSGIREFALQARFDRALQFRDYLTVVWGAMPATPSYFDWEAQCQAKQDSFDRVRKALVRRAVQG